MSVLLLRFGEADLINYVLDYMKLQETKNYEINTFGDGIIEGGGLFY